MLLIHNDDPDLFKRSENCRSSADSDMGFTPNDAQPLVESFTLGEPAVENRDRISKAASKPSPHLGYQRDLRNKHQNGKFSFKGLGSQP